MNSVVTAVAIVATVAAKHRSSKRGLRLRRNRRLRLLLKAGTADFSTMVP